MKKILLSTLLLLVSMGMLLSFIAPKAFITLPVDLNKSKIEWVGRKIGGKHNGFISLVATSSPGMFECERLVQ